MNRLKSVPLWTAVFALFYMICKHWFGFEVPGWGDISTEIIAIMAILFGVANNPTDRRSF